MDIEQIRKEKAALEQSIRELLNAYMASTGLLVRSVIVHNVNVTRLEDDAQRAVIGEIQVETYL